MCRVTELLLTAIRKGEAMEEKYVGYIKKKKPTFYLLELLLDVFRWTKAFQHVRD